MRGAHFAAEKRASGISVSPYFCSAILLQQSLRDEEFSWKASRRMRKRAARACVKLAESGTPFPFQTRSIMCAAVSNQQACQLAYDGKLEELEALLVARPRDARIVDQASPDRRSRAETRAIVYVGSTNALALGVFFRTRKNRRLPTSFGSPYRRKRRC